MALKTVLIIGEDPSLIDFEAPGAPADMSAAKVLAGLNGSVDRLRAAGHGADLLLTTDAGPVEDQVEAALSGRGYDVVVVGAGLRTLPSMVGTFEAILNALHEKAPRARLAFNTRPDDSDLAALRWL